MRTCAVPLVWRNRTFAVLPHALRWATMRVLSAVDGVSRKPTLRSTPFVPQYFVVITAMRRGVAVKPRMARASISIGAWLTGLIVDAVLAASTHLLRGNAFGEH